MDSVILIYGMLYICTKVGGGRGRIPNEYEACEIPYGVRVVVVQVTLVCGEQRKQNEGELCACTKKKSVKACAMDLCHYPTDQKRRTGTLARSSSWPKSTETSM